MMGSVLVETWLEGVAAPERVRAWQRACAESFMGETVWPTPSPMSTAGFDASLRRRWLDDVLFVEFESNGFGARFRSDSPANEYIGFGVSPVTYGERVTLRDGRTVMAARTEYFWDNARVQEYVQVGTGRTTALLIPRQLLRMGRQPFKLRSSLHDSAGGLVPIACMLKAMIGSLREYPGPIDAGDAAGIRDALLDLIARVGLSEDPPIVNAAVSRAMRRSVETWIGHQLGLSPITTSEAARVHGISQRSLHRLFAQSDSTFSAVVRAIRVSRARTDVLSSANTLQTIARRWGYADASHFSREFRRAYGESPRDTRARR